MLINKDEIESMTLPEKRQLLDMLWESLEKDEYIDNEDVESEEEKLILKERFENYKKNPAGGIEWEKLKKELLKPDNHD